MAGRGQAAGAEEPPLGVSPLADDVLDALSDQIAVLDSEGSIIAVNAAWRRFARENGGESELAYVGASYLAVCEEAIRRGEDGAAEVVLCGLRDLLGGAGEGFSVEYPCHTPTEERWFALRATACSRRSGVRVVVAHQDVTARRRSEAVLRGTERTLRGVLEALPVGVWVMDRTGRIVTVNRAGMRIWAGARYVGPEEFGEYKGWWLDSGKPIAAEEWAASRAIRRGETSLDEEIEIECFDGTHKLILNSALPLRDEDGLVNGAIIVNQEITARKRAETALRASEEKWRKLFAILPVGVSIVDEGRRIVEMNPALAKVLRISAEGLEAGAYRSRRYVRADGTPIEPGELPSVRAIREQGDVVGMEIGIEKEDGEVIWTSVSAAPLPLPEARAVVVTVDVTARKQAEAALRQAKEETEAANRALQELLQREQVASRIDPLTGVTNRRHFFEVARQQLAIARRYAHPLSVILFDLDHFKRVNDTLGHPVGDQVLSAVARFGASSRLRDADVLARYGGEEFVVLLPDCDASQAATAAERIRAAVAGSPAETDRGPVPVTISAGIACLTAADDTLERLIQRADDALYAAKAAGRNRVVCAVDPGLPPV